MLLCVGALTGVAKAERGQIIEGYAVVQSGDLLQLNGVKLRLFGIAAPHLGQKCSVGRQVYPCGDYARLMLEKIVSENLLRCQITSETSKLTVGRCYSKNKDVSALMIGAGWAFAWRANSRTYAPLEAKAQARKVGLWRGRVTAPWLVEKETL